MIRITPSQMAAQWASAPHQYQVNVHNFEVKVGQAAVDVFKHSFDLRRFNSNGSRVWRWKPGWRGKGSILNETGTLKSSIKVKDTNNHVVKIHTDPKIFRRSKRHKGFCFAAVHNNFDSLSPFERPMTGPTQQRKFMGHSTALIEEFERLSALIFNGLPK